MPTDEQLDAIVQAAETWTPKQWEAHRQAFAEAAANDCDGLFEETRKKVRDGILSSSAWGDLPQ